MYNIDYHSDVLIKNTHIDSDVDLTLCYFDICYSNMRVFTV